MPSHLDHIVRIAAAVFAATLLLGCASRTKPPTLREEAFEPCEGRAVLVIRSYMDTDVEIVQHQRGSGGGTVLAIVRPGYREIDVPNVPGYSYSARPVGGRTVITGTSRPRARDRRTVELRIECRSG